MAVSRANTSTKAHQSINCTILYTCKKSHNVKQRGKNSAGSAPWYRSTPKFNGLFSDRLLHRSSKFCGIPSSSFCVILLINRQKDENIILALIAVTPLFPTRTLSRWWSPTSLDSSPLEKWSSRTTARPWRGRRPRPACPAPERPRRGLLARARANCGLSLRTRTR